MAKEFFSLKMYCSLHCSGHSVGSKTNIFDQKYKTETDLKTPVSDPKIAHFYRKLPHPVIV